MALTWKNMRPVDSSGILKAINESGKLIGTGISGIGDAITGYSDDRTARETDAFVASLLQAGDDNTARDALMTNQNMGFIDQNRINTFEQARQDKILAEANKRSFLDLETAAQIKINNEKPSNKINVSYGKDPLETTYTDRHTEDEGFWSFAGFGSGFDQDDKDEFSSYKSRFLAEHPDISAKQFNQFATDRVSFKDEWWYDRFTFSGNDDKEYDFGNYRKSKGALYDAMITAKSKGKDASDDEKMQSTEFKAFVLANPQYTSATEAWKSFLELNKK
jgi:hypothetical protein